jgi:hypothetical protein
MSNVDKYHELIDVIEQEFGLKWLAKKARLRPAAAQHPIPRQWAEARAALEAAQTTRTLELTPELAGFFDLAFALLRARTLPGYREAITQGHLKSLTYEKECYVAYIATLGLASGYDVEFIETSTGPGERTPDLLMTRGSTSLQVECKRKDSYAGVPRSLAAWNELDDELRLLHRRLTCGYEVIVCAVGSLDESDVGHIARRIEEILAAGEEGVFSIGIADCVLLVQRDPETPPGIDGVWIPAWQNPGSVAVSTTVDQDGETVYGPMLRKTLYIIDAHKLSQVLSSFDSARGQLAASGIGVIYIGLDMSAVRPGDRELYLHTTARSLRNQFGPRCNTRVAAVVLTGWTDGIEVRDNWHFTRQLGFVVRNPHFPGSADLIIPGEVPTP